MGKPKAVGRGGGFDRRARKAAWVALAAAVLGGGGLMSALSYSPGEASAVSGYRVTGTGGIGLRARNAPRVSGAVLYKLGEGQGVDISCQSEGDVVNGSRIWDRLRDGAWVTDYYLSTPVFNGFSPGIPNCNQSSGGSPAPAPAPVTAPPPTPAAAPAYVRYAIVTPNAQMRSGPGYQYADLGVIGRGTPVDVVCQQRGTPYAGSTLWNKLTGGQWVHDATTNSPNYNTLSPPNRWCDAASPQPSAAPPPPPARGGPPATARSIGYNPFAANYSDQCTYYAEQRMAQQTGKYMPVYGHAYLWPGQARAGGWTVGSAPAVNSVVAFPARSFGSSVGHVAWVVEVSGNRLRIQDYNWHWAGARVTDHWVTAPAGTQYIYSDR